MARAAKVKKGEVDIELMAKEQKISLRKIKVYLNVPPKTANEARELYHEISNLEQKTDALKAWVSLCTTAADIKCLLQIVPTPHMDALKPELLTKWLQLWDEELAAATSFETAHILKEAMPNRNFYDLAKEEECAKALVSELLSYFETAQQGTMIYGLASDANFEDKGAFVEKWVGLCRTPEEIKGAFDACFGAIKAFTLKRIDICTSPKELKRIYNQHTVHGSYEREFILKMAEFYRK